MGEQHGDLELLVGVDSRHVIVAADRNIRNILRGIGDGIGQPESDFFPLCVRREVDRHRDGSRYRITPAGGDCSCPKDDWQEYLISHYAAPIT